MIQLDESPEGVWQVLRIRRIKERRKADTVDFREEYMQHDEKSELANLRRNRMANERNVREGVS